MYVEAPREAMSTPVRLFRLENVYDCSPKKLSSLDHTFYEVEKEQQEYEWRIQEA